jgi:hypothetical protein
LPVSTGGVLQRQDAERQPDRQKKQSETRNAAERRNPHPKETIMKTKARASVVSLVLAIVATALWVAPVAAAGSGAPRIAPPQSHAYGKTLTEWLGTYWYWGYTGADPAQSIVGHVKLLPAPAGVCDSGSFTPDDPLVCVGHLAITLRPGTPFVLPLAAWIVERYSGYPGVPDDPAIPDGVFLAGVSPILKIDGRVIVSDRNKADFYVPLTALDPIAVYPTPSSYGSVAAVAFQGYGIVSPPLSVGTHVIHLYEPYIIDSDSFPYHFGLIYDNTWIVTVTPH